MMIVSVPKVSAASSVRFMTSLDMRPEHRGFHLVAVRDAWTIKWMTTTATVARSPAERLSRYDP